MEMKEKYQTYVIWKCLYVCEMQRKFKKNGTAYDIK